MSAYKGFASVYDLFMEEVEYDQWIAHLEAVWQKYGQKPKTVVDIGCGTGNGTIPLARKGYSMTGVDLSYDMLAVAQKKASGENLNIHFFCQDMTDFQLPRQTDAIVSFCDSLNYLTEDGELAQAFAAVCRGLAPEGLFLFDMNTEYQFQEVLGNQTFASAMEDAAYFWENEYDEGEKMNTYYVTFFQKETGGERYDRTEECHYERAYSIDEVRNALTLSGMELLGVYDGYSFDPAKADSGRYFFVAKRKEDLNV